MKLYATTTSERASKGQGGNEFVMINFLAETEKGREVIAEIELVKIDDEAILKYQKLKDNIRIGIAKELQRVKLKGKKQQGENKCKVCGMGSESEPESDDCIF